MLNENMALVAKQLLLPIVVGMLVVLADACVQWCLSGIFLPVVSLLTIPMVWVNVWMPVYAWFFIAALFGILLCSKNKGKRIKQCSTAGFFFIGLLGAVLMSMVVSPDAQVATSADFWLTAVADFTTVFIMMMILFVQRVFVVLSQEEA